MGSWNVLSLSENHLLDKLSRLRVYIVRLMRLGGLAGAISVSEVLSITTVKLRSSGIRWFANFVQEADGLEILCRRQMVQKV